ncbi:hypothetical protein FKE98_11695 [Corynebacterium aurimucosum]|uniref:Uncharacterized protein n=1 Tax=Corynebacterium guaraldiae TaxID=3051103 RepID=A0ABY3CR53_9CORY|nr:hypothetical protein [Corynebacterium aurimucosum]MTD97369.1 hypothetical protein [Corynebacterium guaraldiae]MBE7365625.1 hypothetical protein [Corynebacterium aurimucosum]MTE11015.1 hypothetical protein [Corynebacterium guaraldiae]NJJ83428.1 hypothetical protein [Corynebacterium aurimucosum]
MPSIFVPLVGISSSY